MPRQLGFFCESGTLAPHSNRRDQTPVRTMEWVPVPSSGVSCLTQHPDSLLQIATDRVEFDPESLLVETVQCEHQLYLVLITNDRGDVRLNGVQVGPVSILRPGDQVQIGVDCVLHVSALRKPYIGVPDEESLGRACPICRVPIAKDRTIYGCPDCGTVMHCEGEDSARSERLECALTCSACPRCGLPIVMTEEYAYVPEV